MTRNRSIDDLHEMARAWRAIATPGEIAHAAKVARANMRLCAKAKEHWRRQCREELDDGRRPGAFLSKFQRELRKAVAR
jgi:hypothetical protein